MHKRIQALVVAGAILGTNTLNTASVFADENNNITLEQKQGKSIESDKNAEDKNKTEPVESDKVEEDKNKAESSESNKNEEDKNKAESVEPDKVEEDKDKTEPVESDKVEEDKNKAESSESDKIEKDSKNLKTISIDDVNLLKAINKSLNKGDDVTTPVTQADLERLVVLRGENFNISNLTGLEKAINLKEVYLKDNNINNIDSLRNLSKVDILDLSNNKITDISALSTMTILSRVYLSNNKITDISSLNNLSNITILKLNNNKISTNTLEGLSNLSEIDLSFNNITGNLEIISADNLKQVLANNNIITGFNGNGSELSILNLSNNNITDVSNIISRPSLKKLYINDNKITSINNIDRYINLVILSAENNKVSDATSVNKLINLEELNLSNNKVDSKIDISKCTKLINVNLSTTGAGNEIFNQITKLSNLYSKIRKINLSNNNISDISKIEDMLDKNVDTLNLDGNHISNTKFAMYDYGRYAENLSIKNQTIHKNVIFEYNKANISLDSLLKLTDDCKILEISNISNSGKLDKNENKITWDTNEPSQSFNFKAQIRDYPHGYNDDIFNGTYTLNIKYKANIKGVEDITIEEGSNFNKTAGVTIEDDEPVDMRNLVVEGEDVNTSKPGVYKLTYKYTDQQGNETIVQRTVKVIPSASQIVDIPDNNLRKELNKLLGNNNAFNKLTVKELESIRGHLDLRNKNIKNLEGIQYLKNVTSLDLSNKSDTYKNDISDLSMLDRMESLTTLNISKNPKITNISNLAKLKQLNTLTASSCGITEIGNWADTPIKNLDLSSNNVKNIDGLSGANKLEILDISHTKVTDISNLSELKKLKTLKANEADIQIIGNWDNSPIETVWLWRNYKLTDISGFSKANSLKYLDANTCKIDTLGDWDGSNIVALKVHANRIKDISGLKNMTKLETLYLDNNLLTSITSYMDGLSSLKDLSLSYNSYLTNISGFKDRLPAIESLDLTNTSISDFDVIENLNTLKDLKLRNTEIHDLSKFNTNNLSNLEKLDLGNNEIQNLIDMSNLSNLKELQLDNNSLTDISLLSSLSNLTTIKINNNKVSDISSLTNLRSLTSINIDNNKVYDLTPINWYTGDLKARNQNIEAPKLGVEANKNGIFLNIVKGLNGPVTNISGISNGGKYNSSSNKITWYTPAIGSTQQYSFSNGDFSGTVTVPIDLNVAPIITAFDKNFFVGDTINDKILLDSVSGYDVNDGNIDDRVKVISNNIPVDSKGKATTPGKYTVEYSLTDNAGAVVKKTVNITIRSNESPKILGANNVTIKVGEHIDLKSGISIKDDHDSNEELLAKLKIDSSKLDTNTPGIYPVKYTVTDSNGNTTEHIRVITVRSNDRPVIVANNVTIKVNSPINLLTDKSIGLKATDTEDGTITNRVTVKSDGGLNVNSPQIGTYTIVYTVTDNDGNITDKSITVTVRSNDNL